MLKGAFVGIGSSGNNLGGNITKTAIVSLLANDYIDLRISNSSSASCNVEFPTILVERVN